MPFARIRCAARIAVIPVLGLFLIPGPVQAEGSFADETLTANDKDRLDRSAASRKSALAEARAGGSDADVAELDTLLALRPQPILGHDIRGEYRCRTMKLGGMLPLTIYGWFDCTIDEDDMGYRLVKTSGSQRFSGNFIDESENRLTYYGAAFNSGEAAGLYGDNPDNDQVGHFIKIGPSSYRLELPEPRFESNLDIIELQPK
jgi:hypothetical protein